MFVEESPANRISPLDTSLLCSTEHRRHARWTTRAVWFSAARRKLHTAALWSIFAPPFSLAWVGKRATQAPTDSAGVVATARMEEENGRNTEALAVAWHAPTDSPRGSGRAVQGGGEARSVRQAAHWSGELKSLRLPGVQHPPRLDAAGQVGGCLCAEDSGTHQTPATAQGGDATTLLATG